MLIMTDANCLGVYLDQFGERILQAPGYGDSAAQADIEAGEFLGCKFRGGID